MSEESRQVFEFGPFRLDTADRRLRREGASIELPPKVFDALVLLVERAGRLVSKHDFHATLWSGSVVTDANLNKYVWQLRKALGDGEGSAQYIETVPKLGYRFVAPVGVAAPDRPPQPAPVRRPNRWAVPLVAALALIAGAVGAWRIGFRASTRTSGTHVLAVAMPVDQLPQPDSAWLATAVRELLADQFAGLPGVRVIPAEAQRDFGATGSTTPPLLGADWTLRCSYLALASEGAAADIRVDCAMSDAGGSVLAQASRDGRQADLFEVVGAAGADLRDRLALRDVRENAYGNAGAVVPRDARAAAAYANGLATLRTLDAARAVQRLKEAVALAPDFAPAHAALARAWSLLGYDRQAGEAATTAKRLAAQLPRERQLHYAGQAAELARDWPEAIRAYQALATFAPDNPEYALLLASAQVISADTAGAHRTLDRLAQSNPRESEDPRLAILRARAFHVAGDYAHGLEQATLARSRAERENAPLLAAEGALQQGWCLFQLGRIDEARRADEAAREGFRAAGHGTRAARAMQQIVELAIDDDDRWAASGPAIEALLEQSRATGYKRGELQALPLQTQLYWLLGDYGRWREANRDWRSVAAEFGDAQAQADAQTLWATLEAETGATEDALNDYRQAQARYRVSGYDHLAWLTLDADLLRLRADFAALDARLDEAEAAANHGDSARYLGDIRFSRGQAAFDRRALDQASQALAAARDAYAANDNRAQLLPLAGLQAQVALARGDERAARDALADGEALAQKTRAPNGRALFAARRAAVLAALGDAAAANAAASDATALLPQMTSDILRLQAQAELAADRWLLGERETARALWQQVASDASRRKLELLVIEASTGLACATPAERASTTVRARQHGFMRIVAWAQANCF